MPMRFLSKDINDIFLLNSATWLDVISTVPNIPIEQDNAWWLCDKSRYRNRILCVTRTGTINEKAGNTRLLLGIRPCFSLLVPETVCPEKGEKVYLGNMICTVINCFYTAGDAYCDVLSDRVVMFRTFGETCNYSESEIYKYIHSDDFRMICGLERVGVK